MLQPPIRHLCRSGWRTAWSAGLALLGGCTGLGLPMPASEPEVPAALRPGADQKLLQVVPARGVQIYECRLKANAAGYEWALVAPEAELFDERGRRIGRHYVGPHWEAEDGSRIAGTLKARAEAPAAGAIPWLLLQARSEGGEGTFSRVSSVQRIHTVGGVAPAAGCSAAKAGATARVPYTADYVLFVPR